MPMANGERYGGCGGGLKVVERRSRNVAVGFQTFLQGSIAD